MNERFYIDETEAGRYNFDTYAEGQEADYEDPKEEKEDSEDEKKREKRNDFEFDPEQEPEFARNFQVVVRGGTNVALQIAYEDFCTPRFDLMSALFGGGRMNFGRVCSYSGEKIRKLFKFEEDYLEFVRVLYIEQNRKRAREIWNDNCEKLIGYLRPLYCGDTEPATYWKIDDPGSQGFGQNFPLPIAAAEFYGGRDHYNPMRVGLPDFTCWAIKLLTQRYRLARDIFRLLCSWTLQAEGEHAFKQLGFL
jgi:hypothetical protein